MKKLAILGLGHVGGYVHSTLKQDANFAEVNGFDITNGHDLKNNDLLNKIISEHDGVLASTPFYLNKQIASVCFQNGVDYFDLTESVEVTDYVRKICSGSNSKSRFVTQCGLAPGMVSIIANHLATQLERVEDIEIRVGALPVNPTNSIGYYRTWNTEGLINEYIHVCPALVNGELKLLEPAADVTKITFDGLTLEAANTSGGVGSLPESYLGHAKNVTYQTLRYPGHWNHVQFLKRELGLKENFDTYVKLFNENIPVTKEDIIYILVTVTGYIDSVKTIKQYSKRIMHNDTTTAIQLSTAGGVMAVLDSWNRGDVDHLHGWVRQEELNYASVWSSKYAESYHN